MTCLCYLFFGIGLIYSLYYLYRLVKFLSKYILAQIKPIDLLSFGSWAIITGGSNGIGRGYAIALAKRKVNVFLISNEEEKLKNLCKYLTETYQIKAEYLFFDYSKTDYSPIEKSISSKSWKHNIGILINNVGVDILPNTIFSHEIEKQGFKGITSKCNTALNINCLSQAAMTALILPILEAKNKGIILSLSSVASLTPVGGMQLYSGTKSFNHFFSRAISKEIAHSNSGIIVQTVKPTFVRTNMSNGFLAKNKGSFIDRHVEDAETFSEYAVRTIGFIDQTHGSIWQEIAAILTMKYAFYFNKANASMIKGVIRRYKKSKKVS